MKSNPTTIEWLLSPTIFSDQLFYECEMAVRNKHYNEYKLAKHYISMAKQNYKKYETSLTEKKQVYIMRGIINARRVIEGRLPIMNMSLIKWKKNIDWWENIEETDEYVEDKVKTKWRRTHVNYDGIFKRYYKER